MQPRRSRPTATRRLVAGTIAVLAGWLQFAPFSSPAAAAETTVPLRPVSATAVVRPGHIIDVTFQLAPTGPQPGVVYVEVWSVAGWKSKVAQVNPDAPPVTFHVPTGQFAALVHAVNSAGKSPAQLSNFVTVAAGCATADVCVNVDPVPGAPSTNRLPAQGFLDGTRTHDTPPITPDFALTNALRPKQWRSSGAVNAFDVAPYGSSSTLMMSGQWQAEHNGMWPNPAAEMPTIRAWAAATVQQAMAWGAPIEYWDLWNEPDNFQCASGCEPATVLQFLLRIYQGIKDASPNAKIVGPSAAQFVDSYLAPTNRLNVRTFLEFAAANNMKLDAVAWHENNEGADLQETTGVPAQVADHVRRYQALIARLPALGQPKIFINEYGKQSTHLLPGWIVGYMTQIDNLGVSQANRSCWGTECADAGLDGLLTRTGSSWTGTTPAYWTHRAYADMDGGARLATNSSVIWRFDGTSTRHDSTSTIRVLLGQHWNCNLASGNTWCTNAYNVGTMSASVSVAWPYGGTTAKVTVRRIAAGISPVPSPAAVVTTANVVGGRVVVPLTAIADGDAISVEITR